MYFNLETQNKNEWDSLKFLNSSARCFYGGKDTFLDANFADYFKGVLHSAMCYVERCIRGTFGCDLFLKSADVETLKKMFPYACELLSINEKKDVLRLARVLEPLRNMNSHATIGKYDSAFLKEGFPYLKKAKRINYNIRLYDKGITVGGIVYLIFLFLREESIKILTSENRLFGLITCGHFRPDADSRFPKEISKVNLEIGIRQKAGDDILGSVVGEFDRFFEADGNEFKVHIGIEKSPSFKVSGSLENGSLRIVQGSLTKRYYHEDFEVSILDASGFISLSNQLPPFVFVDYLAEKGITVFDEKVCATIQSNFDSIAKLNRPKFYTDKDIKILLLPKTASDFRLLSEIVCKGINAVFLILEAKIYNDGNMGSDGFSDFAKAMAKTGASSELIAHAKLLRNFVSHSYILNEIQIYNEIVQIFSLDFAIETLKEMLTFFQETSESLYLNMSENIKKHLINKLVVFKYKPVVLVSKEALKTYPDFSRPDLEAKNKFVDSSTFDIDSFGSLIDESMDYYRVIKIETDLFGSNLYLFENDLDQLKAFAKEHGLTLARQASGTLLRRVCLK